MLFCLGTVPTFRLDLVTMLGAGGTANPDLGPLAGLDTLGIVTGLRDLPCTVNLHSIRINIVLAYNFTRIITFQRM